MPITQFDVNKPLENPYRQFELTVADGAIETVFYNFSYLQILELSTTTGVSLKFGGQGAATNVVGAGVGYELPVGYVSDRVEIINNSGGALNVTLGLAIGKITDSRFTASGTIVTTDVGTTLVSGSNTSVTSTVGLVSAANTARKEIIICAASGNSSDLFFGDATITNGSNRGVILQAGQTIILNTTAAIYGGSTGATGTVYILENEY
jgi:hypothetical protein